MEDRYRYCIPMEVNEMYPDTNKPRSNAHTTKLKQSRQNGKENTHTPDSTKQRFVTTRAVLFHGTQSTNAPRTILTKYKFVRSGNKLI